MRFYEVIQVTPALLGQTKTNPFTEGFTETFTEGFSGRLAVDLLVNHGFAGVLKR
jgi:hypothetical protein